MRIVAGLFCCAALFPVTRSPGATVETCHCVDYDFDVERASDFSRSCFYCGYLSDIAPPANLSCCLLRMDEAMSELNPIWTRVSSSIKYIHARQDSLFSEFCREKRPSLLLEYVDLQIEYRHLWHEMVNASYGLNDKYSCWTLPHADHFWCGDRRYSNNHSKLEYSGYIAGLDNLTWVREEIISAFEKAYKNCLRKHRCRKTYYEFGLFYQNQKEYWKSADLMSSYIQCSKELPVSKAATVESYENLSDSYQLMLQYDKAIEVLTEAIEKYPDRKDLYVRRVAAYFELGKTDEALKDFLEANLDDQLIPDPSRAIQANAFVKGASRGLVEGLHEFPLSCLYSLMGAGQMLWVGVSNPLGAPSIFMDELQIITNAFREKGFGEILQSVAPELHALATSWDSLPVDDRWEKMGFAFGKYGFDVFSSMGIRKLQEAFLRLRSVNTLCNVKTLASSDGKDSVNSASEQIAANRKAFFDQSNIQWDRQGKHIEGHNSRNTLSPEKLETYSILTHKDPEGLLREYAGKGSPKPIRGGEPWETGYKEEVNFKRPIGIWKSENGKESRETAWGTIHYGKDGSAHIVPTKPKDEL